MHALITVENRKIILCGKENLVLILWPGKTILHCDSEEGKVLYCSIVPLGVVKTISSTGLKWNLDGLNFGFRKDCIISTSNEFAESTVTIETTEPCLFILDLEH